MSASSGLTTQPSAALRLALLVAALLQATPQAYAIFSHPWMR
jgi:hypothetical protein